ncbi:MAG: Tryptophan synthase alpha chain [Labilithrix sp.]|nr:Tryptophan synthase alpha chain [Labilithrix sp.]
MDGVCRAETCEAPSRTTCGSRCVLTRQDPDHCGACGTTCGAKQACHEGACVDVFGSGVSCADPIVMPGSGDNIEVAFTFDGATEKHVLTCGEPAARPRKVFRFTANKTKDGAKFEVQGGLATNDLVLEAFRDASCNEAAAIGCNDDQDAKDKRPALTIAIESGKTYFLVVSSKGPPPAGRFYMNFDD